MGAHSCPDDGALSHGNCNPLRPRKPRIAGRARKIADAVVEDALGRVRLQKAEDRNDERLDVPHHVAVVVVVVVPGREAEDRGRCGRRDVRRAEQVKESGVGERLPTLRRPTSRMRPFHRSVQTCWLARLSVEPALVRQSDLPRAWKSGSPCVTFGTRLAICRST